MNLKEFIQQIPKDGWELISPAVGLSFIRKIRRTNGEHPQERCCPLTATFDKPAMSWGNCADDLKIPRYIAEYITLAADKGFDPDNQTCFLLNTHHSNIVELRKILLNALGLKE